MDITEIPRSKNKVFTGVVGGLAEYSRMEYRQARAIFLMGILLTGGIAFAAYVILSFLMPPPGDFDINDFRQD